MARKTPKKKKKAVKEKKIEKIDENEPMMGTAPMGILRKLTTRVKSRHSLFDDPESSPVEAPEPPPRRMSLLPDNVGAMTGCDPVFPEWYEDLTDENVTAFKDLFDMLDSANTGTLNVDSLYDSLKRVDSDIQREEVESVLKRLDKDGNGEIDFEEFLYHVTQGDLSMETGDEHGKKKMSNYSKRQRLFYTAITQYTLKQTLGDMDYRYFARMRQPHVLSHYTAGVRLIGLTDRQLAQQMKKMQKSARNNNSPYAKPLPFVSQSGSLHRPVQIGSKEYGNKYKFETERVHISVPITDAKVKLGRVSSSNIPTLGNEGDAQDAGNNFSNIIQIGQNPLNRFPGATFINKLRSQISMLYRQINKTFSETFAHTKLGEALGIRNSPMDIIAEREKEDKMDELSDIKRKKNHRGWTVPKEEPITVPLPVLKIKYKKHKPTIDDLPNIREKATKALNEFYHNMQRATVRHSLDHWEKLYADTIRPTKLLENFRTVYRAYSPHKEEEAFVVCPWIPGPYRHFSRRIKQINHQSNYPLKQQPSILHTLENNGRARHLSNCETRPLSSMF